MPFTMEETHRYLGIWYQENFAHWGEPNDPHTQEIVGLVRTEALRQQSMWRREPFDGNERDDILQMVVNIRNFAPRIGAKLTEGIMTEIVSRIREVFPDAEHCTLDVFRNENDKERVIQICNWVQRTLREQLHLGKNPSLSVVSRIIHLVADAFPIITNSLKKSLHSLGYLLHRHTEKMAMVLDAICRFLYDHNFIWDIAFYILQRLNEEGLYNGNIDIAAILWIIKIICDILQQMYNDYHVEQEQ